jgi:hypothetical protein
MKSKPLRVVVLRGLGFSFDHESPDSLGGIRKRATPTIPIKARTTDGGKPNENDQGIERENQGHDLSHREEADEQPRTLGENDDD